MSKRKRKQIVTQKELNITGHKIESSTNLIQPLHEKMKFSIKDFLICIFLQAWSHLLKKSLLENVVFYALNLVASELCNFILPLPLLKLQ